jgi:hypothetical protein
MAGPQNLMTSSIRIHRDNLSGSGNLPSMLGGWAGPQNLMTSSLWLTHAELHTCVPDDKITRLTT